MDSVSSEVRVPSLREVVRKSMMARARRFLESKVVDAWRLGWSVMVGMWWEEGGDTMMALKQVEASKA